MDPSGVGDTGAASEQPASKPRLQKALAAAGVASRRVCEDMIEDGRITINGVVATLGDKVDPLDVLEVDGAVVSIDSTRRTVLLNKPVGVISTAEDTHGRPTVVELVGAEERLFPVGRLDADSEGLLLLTNDGGLTQRLTHPSYGVDKEYLVSVEGASLSRGALRFLREGVELEDGITAPAKVSEMQPGMLKIVIHEGRNRQIRRMCEAVGHPVTRLVRTRIGPLSDNTLKPGEWREVDAAEVREIEIAIATSQLEAADDARSEAEQNEQQTPEA